jgi:Amt family ammonium transporter
VVTWTMMKLIMLLPHPWKLRVEEHGETGPGGLDMFDHGATVYDFEDGEPNISSLFEKTPVSV